MRDRRINMDDSTWVLLIDGGRERRKGRWGVREKIDSQLCRMCRAQVKPNNPDKPYNSDNNPTE